MGDYQAMKKELEKKGKALEKANEKSEELDENASDVKKICKNLKQAKLSKDNYVLNKDDKEKLESFISQVEETNVDFKNIQELSVTLKDVGSELKENRKQIKILAENNEALNLIVNSLSKNITSKENEISELKEENSSLKNMVQNWKSQFFKIIHFLTDRIIRNKNREKYMEFATDLYTHGALDEKHLKDLRESVNPNKNSSRTKEKDDYER